MFKIKSKEVAALADVRSYHDVIMILIRLSGEVSSEILKGRGTRWDRVVGKYSRETWCSLQASIEILNEITQLMTEYRGQAAALSALEKLKIYAGRGGETPEMDLRTVRRSSPRSSSS